MAKDEKMSSRSILSAEKEVSSSGTAYGSGARGGGAPGDTQEGVSRNPRAKTLATKHVEHCREVAASAARLSFG